MTTDDTITLTEQEANDLTEKLTDLGKNLSANQRAFLQSAIMRGLTGGDDTAGYSLGSTYFHSVQSFSAPVAAGNTTSPGSLSSDAGEVIAIYKWMPQGGSGFGSQF